MVTFKQAVEQLVRAFHEDPDVADMTDECKDAIDLLWSEYVVVAEVEEPEPRPRLVLCRPPRKGG